MASGKMSEGTVGFDGDYEPIVRYFERSSYRATSPASGQMTRVNFSFWSAQLQLFWKVKFLAIGTASRHIWYTVKNEEHSF